MRYMVILQKKALTQKAVIYKSVGIFSTATWFGLAIVAFYRGLKEFVHNLPITICPNNFSEQDWFFKREGFFNRNCFKKRAFLKV